jgi:hypothetical protein
VIRTKPIVTKHYGGKYNGVSKDNYADWVRVLFQPAAAPNIVWRKESRRTNMVLVTLCSASSSSDREYLLSRKLSMRTPDNDLLGTDLERADF